MYLDASAEFSITDGAWVEWDPSIGGCGLGGVETSWC